MYISVYVFRIISNDGQRGSRVALISRDIDTIIEKILVQNCIRKVIVIDQHFAFFANKNSAAYLLSIVILHENIKDKKIIFAIFVNTFT